MGARQAVRRRWTAIAVGTRQLLDTGRLPDFVIIGAQKAGTTALYRHLCAHPAVIPGLKKEVHYFDREYQRGPAWYRAHFRQAAGVTGEATPYYLFHPEVPVRAQALIPDSRLIVLLRNPVDRAVSHYNHARRRDLEPLAIEAAFEAEEPRLAGGTTACNDRDAHRAFSYLARGIYADQLTRWFAHYPREQVLIVPSEALWNDPVAVASVYEFLGLTPDGRRFAAANSGAYVNVSSAVRRRLEDFYRPHNERLSALLGEDWSWTGSFT